MGVTIDFRSHFVRTAVQVRRVISVEI